LPKAKSRLRRVVIRQVNNCLWQLFTWSYFQAAAAQGGGLIRGSANASHSQTPESAAAQGGWSRICSANSLLAHASRLVAKLRSDFALPLVRAQGIAAESPQDLREQIRGLGAESPVFCGAAAKNAPKDWIGKIRLTNPPGGT
jgi:hypothetical protein